MSKKDKKPQGKKEDAQKALVKTPKSVQRSSDKVQEIFAKAAKKHLAKHGDEKKAKKAGREALKKKGYSKIDGVWAKPAVEQKTEKSDKSSKKDAAKKPDKKTEKLKGEKKSDQDTKKTKDAKNTAKVEDQKPGKKKSDAKEPDQKKSKKKDSEKQASKADLEQDASKKGADKKKDTAKVDSEKSGGKKSASKKTGKKAAEKATEQQTEPKPSKKAKKKKKKIQCADQGPLKDATESLDIETLLGEDIPDENMYSSADVEVEPEVDLEELEDLVDAEDPVEQLDEQALAEFDREFAEETAHLEEAEHAGDPVDAGGTESAQRRPIEVFTRQELYEEAKELDIPGKSRMTKQQLFDAIEEATA